MTPRSATWHGFLNGAWQLRRVLIQNSVAAIQGLVGPQALAVGPGNTHASTSLHSAFRADASWWLGEEQIVGFSLGSTLIW